MARTFFKTQDIFVFLAIFPEGVYNNSNLAKAGITMQDIIRTVEIMECDFHRTLPPKQILEHSLSAILVGIRENGADRDSLYSACGAVWMITHMRFSQSGIIVPGDTLRFHIGPRMIESGRYLFHADVFRGEEQVIQFACSLVPVHKQERHIVRLSLVEPIWKTPPASGDMKQLHRLRTPCEFSPCGNDTIRMSDCDINHHMTSGAYLSLACDALDYWDGPPERYMKMMQIDYSSEVLPGTLLSFERGEADGAKFVRGVKPDGKIAFTAECRFD